ncbi:hypothetical protein C8R45DRAFT_848404, partial [Mycena sanguinolenta]
ARAGQPFIGRWRTTMFVENFWRNLKHGTLHHLLYPRFDQLIHLIVTEVSTMYPHSKQRCRSSIPITEKGVSKLLQPFQKQFKKGWKVLQSRALGDREYQTDISRWTCTCGQQKYNTLLLCKHLVQSVHPPERAFFCKVVVIPFYRHPNPRTGP